LAKLEELKAGARVKGIVSGSTVSVVDVKWYGGDALEVFYTDSSGNAGNEILYRHREADLEVVEGGRAWSFDTDGALFRLVSEAYRIKLAHLFDPMLAVHTSVLEPLPHQITAVYGEMLPRQPLRFLLADDPGAGKTIMAGLLIKELIIRGDLKSCLIICPGSLAQQWQDELWDRFQLNFKLISNQSIEDSRTQNPFTEGGLLVARLDHLCRNDDLLAKLEHSEWDLVIVDEAHKMSAHYFGTEIKETKRHKLGKLVGSPAVTRHFLLMTATPHNGKEEDFQLFLALLDSDRFEGRFRDGVHAVEVSDLMRRMVKENLLRFNGKRLFLERRAETVTYPLSDLEAALYARVTAYVREEMNRADRLKDEGEGRRGNRVGFALTILQRRLASSPEAIYQSLNRRKERLEKRLRETELVRRGNLVLEDSGLTEFTDEDIEDLEDSPSDELEQVEDEVLEQASTARTIEELKAEIKILEGLCNLADRVRKSGTDKKWEELRTLLQDTEEMFDEAGNRRKLIIFTEHRDTVSYLTDLIRTLIGRSEAVVVIQGGMGREERRKIQSQFLQDKDVHVLIATDAAGEGVNLQRANLMINYDLPWNPNRLEQRFGRIHRIGQTEVCFMWNIVAEQTREGEVYLRLLDKLKAEREALGGAVFDVLGKTFEGTELRKLLIQAVRYGDQPEVKAKLYEQVDGAMDHERLRKLIEEDALVQDAMDTTKVQAIRTEMERLEAKRLQPHFIRSFFMEAFKRLGGTIREREPKRYEISHVPAILRSRDRLIGVGEPVLTKYERVCFEKEQINVQGKPFATFVCPGHPLLDTTIDLLLERYRELLKKGALLVDEGAENEDIRVLFYLENSIQDGRKDKSGNRRTVSQRMQFVELNAKGELVDAGAAPYLDCRPATAEEREALASHLQAQWLAGDMEADVISHAVQHIVPEHLDEVRQEREARIERTMVAVKDRLTKEINHWDHRAQELLQQERTGKANARINSGKARQRADELQARLQRRLDELQQEQHLSARPPSVIGGAIIVPQSLLNQGRTTNVTETKASERKAMQGVMEAERKLGNVPRDVHKDNLGYDIESLDGESGHLRFIEVKGRVSTERSINVSRNEIMTALNKPDEFILAIVHTDLEDPRPYYIRRPFRNEPDFAVTSIQYNMKELLAQAERPG
jgi:superfamily II DNA or RNA helicase